MMKNKKYFNGTASEKYKNIDLFVPSFLLLIDQQ